ncbi:MAG TPA: hypothetical protein VH109_13670 [Steroidobacteraceae bacterium]|jgi:hypothetical protein|nr:hypothetical protein [Steroidobacteraceae bacterium]
MRLHTARGAIWLLAALAAVAARADDTHKGSANDDPDPSFLEFLGSVDGLADTNPDYIAQAPATARVTPPPAPGAPKAAPPPPPPPPTPGAKNNE